MKNYIENVFRKAIYIIIAWFGFTVSAQDATYLDFDGVDDVVVCGKELTNHFIGKSTITVEAMVYPTDNDGHGIVVGNYDYPKGSSSLQFLIMRAGDTWNFYINDGEITQVQTDAGSVVLNSWQHVAGVWDGTTVSIYIDGVLQVEKTTSGSSSLITVPSDVVLGWNANNEGFKGGIDEVRIWDIARTSTEILNNKDSELVGNETGLQAYYQFNQGTNNSDNTAITSLLDKTENHYNGALNNFALTGNFSNWSSVSVNATPVFTESENTSFTGVESGSVAFADVDGDNDQDVLITGAISTGFGSSIRINKLYTNDGNGNFTEVTDTPFQGVRYSSIAFADVDGDEDQDVLITGSIDSGRITKLYTNNGSGSFTEVTGTPFQSVYFSSIAFADVDGDEDQDVLITGYASSGRIAKLYTNNGRGNFTEVTDTPFEGVSSSSIAFADIDGDNDQDVLITGSASSGRIAKLYTNEGSGNFTEVTSTPFQGVSSSSIAFADVDGDNDQDVLITGSDGSAQISKLYTNDGNGSFTEVTDTPFLGVQSGSIVFADVDGDEDQDVLITGYASSGGIAKLYINNGSGSFTEVTDTPFEGVYYSSIAFADVDGNDEQDVLITGRLTSSGKIAKLYLSGVPNTTPTVTSVTVPENATYTSGNNLDFTVNFSEAITVTGTPQLNITIGATTRQALYQSGSGTDALLYRYTVQTSDLDADGITVETLDVNGGTLRDDANNEAVLALNNIGVTTGILVGNLTFIWTGATDNQWNLSSNWNTNTLPSGTANVIIPSGLTNYPTASSSVSFNTMTINAGASFISQSTVSGSVTYKRNLPTTNWYLVTPPVTNETTENLIINNDFATGTAGNIGIASYKNDGTAWNYLTSTSTGTITPGQGFSIKLANTDDLSFTGNLNTNTITYPITQATNTLNLIGNPYASYINLGSFFSDNPTGPVLSEATIWLWNQATGNYDLKMSGTDASFQIAPGQGFFVSAGANTNVTFDAANQSHQTDTFQKNSRTEVNLTITENNISKSTKLYYINGTTTGFDNGYDGSLFGGTNYNFALFTELISDNQGKKLAIQALPNTDLETMIVPVGIIADAGKEITFSAGAMNLPSGINVYLEDRVNKTFTNLSKNNYNVTLNTVANGIGQFYLHTSSKSLGIKNELFENVSVYKPDAITLRITGLQSEYASIKMFTISGKQVFNKPFKTTGVIDLMLPKLATGTYLIELQTEKGILKKKIIL